MRDEDDFRQSTFPAFPVKKPTKTGLNVTLSVWKVLQEGEFPLGALIVLTNYLSYYHGFRTGYIQLCSYAVIFYPVDYLGCFLTKYIVIIYIIIYIIKFLFIPFHTPQKKNCITA